MLFSTIVVVSQTMVDAGEDQTIYCNGSVQLNATPLNAWAYLNPIIPLTTSALNAVFFPTVESGFATNSMGMVFQLFNGGKMNDGGKMITTNALYSIYFIDSTTGFICGAGGVIFKTTNSGNFWQPLLSGSTAGLRSIYFTSVSTGYAVGTAGTILKTTNGGTTWTLLQSGTTASLYSIFFPTSETGYAVGMSGTLLKTTDAGATWSQQVSGSSVTLYSIHFPTATSGFVAGASGTILKTTDGNNWTKYSADSVYMETQSGSISKTNGRLLKTSVPLAVHFTSATTGYITGGNGAKSLFLKTIDGGTTWFEQVSNGTSKMSAICFPSENVGFAVGGGLRNIMKLTSGEMKPLNYNWSPMVGLSNSGIANPVANPTVTTTYTVSAYDQTDPMNSFTDSINVFVRSLSINIPSHKIIGCEGSVMLDSLKTNYTGSETLKYKWTPSRGLSSDTIANPIASVTDSITYRVLVSTPNGCSVTGITTVNVAPLKVTPIVDKIVICSGTAQLLALTNYSGKSTLHYKWTPSTGLSNDTIVNPTVTVTGQSNYSVQVSTGSGYIATGGVTVKVVNLTVNAGADKTVTCGGTVQFDAVTTNYNGTGVLRYKWTPSTGLNNDTIANPIATGSNTSTYTVTATAPSGCSASDKVILVVSPVTVNVGTDKIVACGTQVQLGVTSTNYTGSELKYKWTPASGLNNDTIASPLATASNITYTLTITTPSGCTASDNVAIGIISMDKPTINYVGISEKNKNFLAWTKPSIGKINSFNVYKETNISNSYTKVGSVSADSASTFIDSSSNPNVQSNKYKLSIVDACGNETALSDFHKTMHLSINRGINTIWNLIWESYEGYSVSTYNIYRGTTPENIQIIGSLSGSNTQFSDYTAPVGFVYYQIEAINSGATGAKQQNKSSVKSIVETVYSSRSNIASNNSGINGLNNLKDISNVLSVYPNPASNTIQLVVGEYTLKNMKLNIYNGIGSLVLTKESLQNKQKININGLKNGIYLLEILSNEYSGIQKLIIQK